MSYSADQYKAILGVSAAAANEMAAGRMHPTADQLASMQCEPEDGQMKLALEPDDEEPESKGD